MIPGHTITRGLVRGRKGVFRIACSCNEFRIDVAARNLKARRNADRRLTDHLAAIDGGRALAVRSFIEAPLCEVSP